MVFNPHWEIRPLHLTHPSIPSFLTTQPPCWVVLSAGIYCVRLIFKQTHSQNFTLVNFKGILSLKVAWRIRLSFVLVFHTVYVHCLTIVYFLITCYFINLWYHNKPLYPTNMPFMYLSDITEVWYANQFCVCCLNFIPGCNIFVWPISLNIFYTQT